MKGRKKEWCCVKSLMLYSSETWLLSVENVQRSKRKENFRLVYIMLAGMNNDKLRKKMRIKVISLNVQEMENGNQRSHFEWCRSCLQICTNTCQYTSVSSYGRWKRVKRQNWKVLLVVKVWERHRKDWWNLNLIKDKTRACKWQVNAGTFNPWQHGKGHKTMMMT